MNPNPSRICLLFNIVMLVSCGSKNPEHHLLTESAKRLEQQTAINLDLKWTTEAKLDELIVGKHEYLKPEIEHYIESSGRLSELISTAIMLMKISDPDALFNQYQDLQRRYTILKQKLQDSIPNMNLDTSSSAFINMDKNAFTQKYMGKKDPLNFKLELLILQADVIANENYFIRKIVSDLTPEWHFEATHAIGIADKIAYKNGEELKLTVSLAKYLPVKSGYAIIDGKRIEETDGIFKYAKQVSEKPGLHKLSFEIIQVKSGKLAIYPSTLYYKVE